ncbi:hypothetical protein [Alkalihalobacillus deserti]|uniref:hypothetical protein n=1 Tax=Alkalihalobacillus deserti TaxID=2879466 RepID=UPI001D15569A|nr:hypothetical protein [Alkalihalobacillus deserti]
MNKETKVANELQKMLTQNEVPISVQEDINQISDSLVNGLVSLNELQKEDQFVVEVIQKAMTKIEGS